MTQIKNRIETFQVVEYNIKKDLKSNDISKVSVIEGMEKYL